MFDARKLARGIALLAAALLFACLAACNDDEAAFDEIDDELISVNEYSEADTWAIYWYLCGSDLESGAGLATRDLMEMLSVDLPENICAVVQTGGAAKWQNNFIDPGYAQRFLYDSFDFRLIGEQPVSNMGSAETLADFLRFCTENYPAHHQVAIIWNHGGGSLSGVAFDEQHENDSLSLDELREAFGAACEASEDDPPFELVGFDACLMASIDTASSLAGFAEYMVASQETEPGSGWNYEGIFGAIADDPGMNGIELGKVICDSYESACYENSESGEITMSVIDLKEIVPLVAAYDNIGIEALAAACENPQFFGAFGREAEYAEKYGPNNRDEGYTNMVDIGDLVRSASRMLPVNAQAALEALDKCVAYKISGPYRKQSSGLSCYYPYDMDRESLQAYVQIASNKPYEYLYEFAVSGRLSDEGLQYARNMEYEALPGTATLEAPSMPQLEEPPEVLSLNELGLEDHPVYVDEDGYAVLDLGPHAASILSGVYFQLAYIDEEYDMILLLGRDNDLYMDWESGVFKDNFRGVWGAIDGCPVYMDITYEGEDYNLYSVPMLLNGREASLRVCYDYNEEAYEILGARPWLEENGMADKNLIKLQPGDEIQTLHYAQTLSSDVDDFERFAVESIIVDENTSFAEEDLGDGRFKMIFEMIDSRKNAAYSEAVEIVVEDGDIYLSN
ncbi:MAG: hypothetical protein LBU32_19785 [Clostridiales bacterium]|jgi:hypothetical protein|nr:hypothetical protein [Clostridiales bacterium]